MKRLLIFIIIIFYSPAAFADVQQVSFQVKRMADSAEVANQLEACKRVQPNKTCQDLLKKVAEKGTS